MEQLVREPRAALVSRVRFVLGCIGIFTLASANAFHTVEEAPLRITLFHSVILAACIAVSHYLPSLVIRAIPALYGGACVLLIIGTFAGWNNITAFSPALLPLFVLSISDDETDGRVLLRALPTLVTVLLLHDWASLLQLALSLCAILYFAESMDDDGEEEEADSRKQRQKTIRHFLVLAAAVLVVLFTLKLYVTRPIKTTVLTMLWLSSVVLIHSVLHISMHTCILPVDDDCGRQIHAPAAALGSTCLLCIVSSISGLYPWINLPSLISLSILLGRLFRRYEDELYLARLCAASQEEDEDLIQTLF